MAERKVKMTNGDIVVWVWEDDVHDAIKDGFWRIG